MMRRAQKKGKYGNFRGLTLAETVLAMAVGAMLLVPLTMGLKMGIESWQKNNTKSEIFQNMRVAMARITSELRYATSLTNADETNGLVFRTNILLDDDDTTYEDITYKKEGNVIRRYVDGADPEYVAGDSTSFSNTLTPVRVVGFDVTPMKLDSMDFVAATVSEAQAVKIDITVESDDGDQVAMSTMVRLRSNY